MLKHVITAAPGKIILSGEHAVVYGKEAVACSVNLRTQCSMDIVDQDKRLSLSFPELKIEISWELCRIHSLLKIHPDVKKPCLLEIGNSELEEFLSGSEEPLPKIAIQLVLSLYISIAANHFIGRNAGLKMEITTELPIGSGLGSSASLCVALTASLLVACGYLDNKQDKWDKESYELINNWAFEGEKLVHGYPSGIDNSVATFGHFISFKAGQIKHLSELNDLKLDILVVNTKKPRSTKVLVADVKSRKEKFPKLYASIFQSIENVAECFKESLLDLCKGKKVEERTTIYKDIEHLVDVNQSLLDSIGVGHGDITRIVNTCKAFSFHGKLTGAGGGGCVIVLIPPDTHKDILALADEKLSASGYECFQTFLGGEGVNLVEVY